MSRASKTKKSSTKSSGGRGSREAIEKRRVARQLNTLLLRKDSEKRALDGRTEKRRQRLVEELKKGRKGTPLKPHDVLHHTHELLQLGETLASLRKQGVRPRRLEFDDEALAVVERHAKTFNYDPRAWQMLGLRVDADGKVGRGAKRATGAKKATKKTTKKAGARKSTRKGRSAR